MDTCGFYENEDYIEWLFEALIKRVIQYGWDSMLGS